MIHSWDSVLNNITSILFLDNTTAIPVKSRNWPFGSIFLATVTCIAFLLNTIVFLMFCSMRRLRSLFALYICALLMSNIVFCATNDWMIIVDQLHNVWPLSYAACTLHMYAAWVWTGVTMHLHLLITINRVWAISFPHSYRSHHNVKSALLMMGAIILYVHVICLPGVLLDAVYYRLPSGCSLNTDQMIIWDAIVMILIYDAPIALMAAALPYLWWQQRKKRRLVTAAATAAKPTVTHAIADENFDKRRGTLSQQRCIRNKHHGFAVLTALTISVVISWTPNQIYYTIAVFRDVDNATVRQLAFILYSLQAIADPVLIVLTFKESEAILMAAFVCSVSYVSSVGKRFF